MCKESTLDRKQYVYKFKSHSDRSLATSLAMTVLLQRSGKIVHYAVSPQRNWENNSKGTCPDTSSLSVRKHSSETKKAGKGSTSDLNMVSHATTTLIFSIASVFITESSRCNSNVVQSHKTQSLTGPAVATRKTCLTAAYPVEFVNISRVFITFRVIKHWSISKHDGLLMWPLGCKQSSCLY